MVERSILDERNQVVRVDSYNVWRQFMDGRAADPEQSHLKVAKDFIGPYMIQTYFWGLRSDPFTTMISVLFPDEEGMMVYWLDNETVHHYSTWDDALDGHDEALSLVRKWIKMDESSS